MSSTQKFANVAVEKLLISTSDGVRLAAKLYQPTSTIATSSLKKGLLDGKTPPIVMFSGAFATPQKLYDYRARFLASNGIPSLTFDYRGIGESMDCFHKDQKKIVDGREVVTRTRQNLSEQRATGLSFDMKTWAQQDTNAAIDFLQDRFGEERRLFSVAHSFGGHMFALNNYHNEKLSGAVLVCCQSGAMSYWPVCSMKYQVLATMYLLQPFSYALGMYPGKYLGLRHDIPGGVALQWSEWVRSKEYFLSDKDGEEFRKNIGSFKGPLLSYGFSDDVLCPEPNHKAFLEMFNTNIEKHWLDPKKDLGIKKVGHFDFFRDKPVVGDLWNSVLDWVLVKGSVPAEKLAPKAEPIKTRHAEVETDKSEPHVSISETLKEELIL